MATTDGTDDDRIPLKLIHRPMARWRARPDGDATA
jgi:hypothetical protein